MMATTAVLAAGGIHVGGWEWTGDFTALDLIAAGTNALEMVRCSPAAPTTTRTSPSSGSC